MTLKEGHRRKFNTTTLSTGPLQKGSPSYYRQSETFQAIHLTKDKNTSSIKTGVMIEALLHPVTNTISKQQSSSSLKAKSTTFNKSKRLGSVQLCPSSKINGKKST